VATGRGAAAEAAASALTRPTMGATHRPAAPARGPQSSRRRRGLSCCRLPHPQRMRLPSAAVGYRLGGAGLAARLRRDAAVGPSSTAVACGSRQAARLRRVTARRAGEAAIEGCRPGRGGGGTAGLRWEAALGAGGAAVTGRGQEAASLRGITAGGPGDTAVRHGPAGPRRAPKGQGENSGQTGKHVQVHNLLQGIKRPD
jgi:hypothetical protein